MKCDALVVGGGPVGLVMASELARYGVSVRIVDKAPQRTDKSKALVVWSRTLELMDRMGCTASFLDTGRKAIAANFSSGKEQIARLTLEGVASPYPFALMIPQNETERLLEQQLNSCGVKLERNIEVTQFTSAPDANEVVSTLRHADGHEETVTSSWLIGCDGAHSTVRRHLGMPFAGSTQPSDWMLADVHLSGVPTSDEITVCWHSDGILVLFPITHDRYRIIADLGDTRADSQQADTIAADAPTLAQVQAVLDVRGPGGIKASTPVWLAYFRINERKVTDYRAGRIFLAGDAAHIHSPAGGQGMNTGIQDACNLAWKLAFVCRGTCAEEPLLSSYSIERSAIGDQVLKAAGRLTAIGIMRGEIKQSIRNHLFHLLFGFAPIRHMAANVVTEISIGYPESPLSVQGSHTDGGPAAGERAPIREHGNSDEQPVGAGNTPRFALFSKADEGASRLLARYPDLLEPKLRAPFQDGGLWLVRPDGYTALSTAFGNWDQAANYLDHISVSEQS